MTLKEIKIKITELKGNLNTALNSDNSGLYKEISFWERELRNQIKANREYNRKKLIKKLFNNVKKDIPLQTPTNLRIGAEDNIHSRISRIYYDSFSNSINLSMKGLRDRIKWGYSNDYYPERHENLNFVIGNKKLALRFVMLHELGHAVMRDKIGIYEMHKSEETCERFADDFAIEQLKNKGWIK